MKPGAKRFLHAATLSVAATGILWGWMAYAWSPGPEPDDPELLLEWTGMHPRLPLVRTLHLFAAPFAVFAVGLIWAGHVAPRLFRPWARRATGLLLALLVGPMVLSGVALQTAASPEAREAWAWTHGITSCFWVAGYLAHLASPSPPSSPHRIHEMSSPIPAIDALAATDERLRCSPNAHRGPKNERALRSARG